MNSFSGTLKFAEQDDPDFIDFDVEIVSMSQFMLIVVDILKMSGVLDTGS